MTSLPPTLTEPTRSPVAWEAAWKTWSSLPLSAPAKRIAANEMSILPAGSAAIATLTSAAVRPSAAIAWSNAGFGLEPRNWAPFMLNFWSVAPPNVLGSSASRSLSALKDGSARLGSAPLASAPVLASGEGLGSGEGDGATEGATDGAATLGAAVAEPPQAATMIARAAAAASGLNG